MKVIVLALLALLTLFNYHRFRDYRYPAFLASVLWLGVLTLYYFRPITVDSISVLTLLIFLVVVLAFTSGAELALLLYPAQLAIPARQPAIQPASPHHPRARIILLLISGVLFPFVLVKANAIAQQSGIGNWLVALRIETSDVGPSPYGVLGNASILSFVTTFLWGIEVGTEPKELFQYYCAIAVSVAYAILATGRTPFLLLCVPLLGISSMRRRLNWRKFSGVGLAFVFVFAIFAVILGKGGSLDSATSDNFASVQESLAQYAIGSIPAFDQVVRSDPTFQYGTNTFVAGTNVVRRFTGGPLISPIQGEVNVPFPWNVYTAVQPPFIDFGIVGVIVAFSAIGAMSTYCYTRAIKGDPLYLFYYSVSLFPLVLMTFTDQYFAPIGSWLKYVLLGYLYFRIGRKEHKEQRLPRVIDAS
jgi:oligosaccharide repeat unit polymerase